MASLEAQPTRKKKAPLKTAGIFALGLLAAPLAGEAGHRISDAYSGINFHSEDQMSVSPERRKALNFLTDMRNRNLDATAQELINGMSQAELTQWKNATNDEILNISASKLLEGVPRDAVAAMTPEEQEEVVSSLKKTLLIVHRKLNAG